MSIDWFTVLAQIVNFLILVWLLKKLLFRPIMNAMERRELGIAVRLRQAHEQMDEAKTLQQHYQHHLQQLHDEEEATLAQARLQAESTRGELLQHLNDEILHKKAQFEADIRRQQQELGEQISAALTEKTLALSNQLLTRLADQTLEQRLIERFLEHLSTLPQKEKLPLEQGLQQHGVTVFTRFQPDEATKKLLQQRINDIAPGCSLTFAQRQTLICGIALETGGRSWEWTIERYLDEVETELLQPPGKAV